MIDEWIDALSELVIRCDDVFPLRDKLKLIERAVTEQLPSSCRAVSEQLRVWKYEIVTGSRQASGWGARNLSLGCKSNLAYEIDRKYDPIKNTK